MAFSSVLKYLILMAVGIYVIGAYMYATFDVALWGVEYKKGTAGAFGMVVAVMSAVGLIRSLLFREDKNAR